MKTQHIYIYRGKKNPTTTTTVELCFSTHIVVFIPCCMAGKLIYFIRKQK